MIKPVAITMGDAAGIGPEIITKIFAQGLKHPAVVFGDVRIIQENIITLGFNDKLKAVALKNIEQISSLDTHQIGVLSNHQIAPDLELGKVSASAGMGAYKYLCFAIEHAMENKVSAIVTAPLNKESMQLAGIDYPGHTEILADKTNTEHVSMVLVNNELRVILVTIHVALSAVPKTINVDLQLKTILAANQICSYFGIKSPRIAVAGLNPHAGENGKFGDEEITIISPAIQKAKNMGINVSGPYAGDTVFMRARQGQFDIVVAQYHDQGLIPIKYMGLDTGVNITAGLPFIRTSVDHGTAFDIAGKSIADASSLMTAFNLALNMASKV